MKDIKVKEERGKAELPKTVRHAPKEFARRGLTAAKEKGVGQLMQAAQNGKENSADTEGGTRPDAQTVVDSSVGLVEDTVAGGKELLRHLSSRENGVRQDEYRDNRRRWKDYAAHMEKRQQAVEQSKRIAAETNLGCAETQRRNIRGPKTGNLLFKEPGRQGKAARSAQGMAKQTVHVPFPVSWTVKMKKKQKETQDILSYHSQAAGCSDKARAKASGGRQPIEECGRTGL